MHGEGSFIKDSLVLKTAWGLYFAYPKTQMASFDKKKGLRFSNFYFPKLTPISILTNTHPISTHFRGWNVAIDTPTAQWCADHLKLTCYHC